MHQALGAMPTSTDTMPSFLFGLTLVPSEDLTRGSPCDQEYLKQPPLLNPCFSSEDGQAYQSPCWVFLKHLNASGVHCAI